MKIYTYKKRWKWFLFIAAVLIVAISLWYTNQLVRRIARDERDRVKIWADAIQRKASLVNYTDEFFQEIREEERKRVKLWANANRKMIQAGPNEDLSFYLEILMGNTTIPVILTDHNDIVNASANVENPPVVDQVLDSITKAEFTSTYEPISNDFNQIIYYKESKLFTELRDVLDDLIESFFDEVVNNYSSAPVIVTDSTIQNVITAGHVDSLVLRDSIQMLEMIAEMKSENKPILIELADQGKRYIFYKDSSLLTKLKYYPIWQFIIVGLFLFVAYMLFSNARKAEQNQVWVGMAKETAHQLGTPLSSMMAWVELLKMKNEEDESFKELQKDVDRLEVITDRFSKIGSAPKLTEENITDVLAESINYIRSRTSKKVEFIIKNLNQTEILIPVNKPLFSWVIENLCKNAIDAMGGSGKITIEIYAEEKDVLIDVRDTGKGIPKNLHKTIFNPGYTSKKRGWGLGLSLSERIIENYHKGRIFVKSSNINLGTTFRIILRKK